MGCTQSSSSGGSSIPPQQLSKRPATKDVGGISTFVAAREKLGIDKVFDSDTILIDNIVAAASSIAFEVEAANAKGKERGKDVKSATMSAVEQAIGAVVMKGGNNKGFNVANWAANELVPFGDSLITICESAFVGFTAVVENKPAADNINDIIIQIVRLLPLFLTFFGEKNDLDGKKIAAKLLENVVASMLLARELSTPQGVAATGSKVIGIQFVLRFLNVTVIKEALAENKRLLFNCVAIINYWTTGRLTSRIANTSTPSATNQSDLEPYLKPLTLLNPPVTDAIQFWRNASDFKDLEDVIVVIEALLLLAVKAGFLKIEKVQGKNFKKLHYFENLKNALDVNNVDVISVKEFRFFLSNYMKKDCESYRVVDAVKVFIDSFSLNSFISVSAFNDDSGGEGAADNGGSVSPTAMTPESQARLISLKGLLSPTGFGLDLSKYWSQYMEGSRLWLFSEIEAWISSKTIYQKNPSRVFLIEGDGGFGKSTIAAKLVDIAKNKNARLFIGGYFFCKYDDSKRRSPCQMIATLAYQLAKNIPEMEEALSKIDPGKVKALASGVYDNFERVFDELLTKPLTEALSSWSADRRVCLLIDALDELDEGSPSRAQLLSLVCNGLLSLPNQVHIIVTCRPDKDILAHLQLIKPPEIEKRDEKQRHDLKLFAKKVIVEGTTLKTNLTEQEKEDAVNVLLVRSKGLFIAMRSSFEHLKRMEIDENRSLSKSDVINLPSNLVDSAYQKSMARIFSRIDAIEDPDVRKTIEAALKRALATLLASSRPLTVEELANLCSGVTIQDEFLTKILLDSLSSLFSFGTSGPIEPLHKTVYDFLLDKDRSKSYFVDVSVGHLILAFSCARILQGGLLSSSSSYLRSDAAASGKGNDKDLFFEDIDLILKNDALGSIDIYALDFGLVHLSKAILCSNGNNDHLIEAWESLFLMKRVPSADDSGRENVLGVDFWDSPHVKRFYKSNMMAKECSLKWILSQAKLGRNSRFTVELEALEDSITSPLDVQNLASGGGEK